MATFPVDDKTEIIYPITQGLKANWINQRTDDNRWRAGIKTTGVTLVRRESTVGFRVQKDSYNTMLTFIHSNYNVSMTLTINGTDIFSNNNVTNTVYIIDYTAYREKDQWYRIDVRFLLE